jgi:fatty acid desaturase
MTAVTDERVLPLGRKGVLMLFLGAATISLAAFWLLAASGGGTSSLLLVALAVPLLIVLAPLFYIGMQVASQADDPDEVEARLAESLGMTKAEFDRRREGEGRYAHPAEQEFDEK